MLLGVILLVGSSSSCSVTKVEVIQPDVEIKVIIHCVEGLEPGSMWNRLTNAASFTMDNGTVVQYQVCQPV
jgi:hypothetical protein